MRDKVGAEHAGRDEHGAKRVVDDEFGVVRVRQVGERGDVRDFERRVCDRFCVEQLGARLHRALDRFKIRHIDKRSA